MRKVALTFIVLAALGVGIPYALNQQLWAVLVCVLVALLFCFLLRHTRPNRLAYNTPYLLDLNGNGSGQP